MIVAPPHGECHPVPQELRAKIEEIEKGIPPAAPPIPQVGVEGIGLVQVAEIVCR
jgi:hypothetical protein